MCAESLGARAWLAAMLSFATLAVAACGAEDSGSGRRRDARADAIGGDALDPSSDADAADDGLSSTNATPTGPRDAPPPMAPEPPPPPLPNGTAGSIDPGCTDDCEQSIIGSGATPFDPSGSSSVGIDAEGALVIAPGQAAAGPAFIWIANTEGRGCTGNLVSKIDTDSLTEVARYQVGFCDPSRTSVNSQGDVFVASRDGRGVTKILAAGQDCPDTNGDGQVTTSTGPTDVLPLGQDDCVAWWTSLPAGDIRGIAAQDVGGEVIVEPRLDGPPVVTTIPPKSYVWASGVSHDRLYKLDGDTGQILIETEAPAGAYGAAIDGNGMLWMTGGATGGGDLGFVDTTQCVDDASCSAPVCQTSCDAGGNCPGDCDGAVKGHIRLPGSKYGITVDCKQRVWLAGWSLGRVQRYDHAAAAGGRLVEVDTLGGHGITADGLGRIWVGNQDRNTVSRIDGDSLQFVDLSLPGPKGMAVDAAGKVWVVRGAGIDGGSSAHVIEPGMALGDNNLRQDVVSGLLNAYTYSDMTGQQLRLASREPSVHVETIDTCELAGEGALTAFRNLTWDAELPDGSYIVFRARLGADTSEVERAAWVEVAAVPGRDSPLDLSGFLDAADQHGSVLQVEISLVSADGNVSSSDGCNQTDGTTPRLLSFGVSYTCPEPGVE